jgi:hypothetical protein
VFAAWPKMTAIITITHFRHPDSSPAGFSTQS